MAVFHYQNQIGPLEDIQIYLASAMGAHVNAMLHSNLLTNFVRRMIDKRTEPGAHHLKAFTQFLFQQVLSRRTTTDITCTNNKYVLHYYIK